MESSTEIHPGFYAKIRNVKVQSYSYSKDREQDTNMY